MSPNDLRDIGIFVFVVVALWGLSWAFFPRHTMVQVWPPRASEHDE